MSDIKLYHFRKRRDRLGRGKIETLSGMNFQPRTIGERSAANDTIELRRRRLPGRDRITPSPGMNLDNRRADFDRGLDLPRLGRDEQRNPNAGLGQFLDDAT